MPLPPVLSQSPIPTSLEGLPLATSVGIADSNVFGGLPFIVNGDDLMSSVDLHVDGALDGSGGATWPSDLMSFFGSHDRNVPCLGSRDCFPLRHPNRNSGCRGPALLQFWSGLLVLCTASQLSMVMLLCGVASFRSSTQRSTAVPDGGGSTPDASFVVATVLHFHWSCGQRSTLSNHFFFIGAFLIGMPIDSLSPSACN